MTKWYWCQNGKTLEAVVLTERQLKDAGAIADAGPFQSRRAALEDALSDYAVILRQYAAARDGIRKALGDTI